MHIGITCYPTHGGSGVFATELGKQLALRGHTVSFHQLLGAVAAGRPAAAGHLSRGGGRRVPAAQAVSLHAGAGRQDDRSGDRQPAAGAARALRHPVLAGRDPGSADGPGVEPEGGDHAARHRHFAGRRRALLPSGDALLDRTVGRRHHGVRIPARGDGGHVRGHPPDRGDSELRRPRSLPARGARRWRQEGGTAHLQLPRGQACRRRDPRVRPRAGSASMPAWCWSATAPT